MPFRLFDPSKRPSADQGPAALAQRLPPSSLTSHRAAAPSYVPSEELIVAINAALHLCAPLLLTGEPGCGKTQVAYHLAWHFRMLDRLFLLDVRSSTTAGDLLYEFDSVAYFREAQAPRVQGASSGKHMHVRKGPLWKAIEAANQGQPAIVLLDEIDKAPRDFPNDILTALDQSRFEVPEWDDAPGPEVFRVERKPGVPPPILVITSNSERRLPEAFLRRCVFHHIEFTEELVSAAVSAHRHAFETLSNEQVALAIERFLELRKRSLRKRPATAELLAWLLVLSADLQNPNLAKSLSGPLDELPHLSVLIKDRDDLTQIR